MSEQILETDKYVQAFTAAQAKEIAKKRFMTPMCSYIAVKEVKLVKKYGQDKFNRNTYWVRMNVHFK